MLNTHFIADNETPSSKRNVDFVCLLSVNFIWIEFPCCCCCVRLFFFYLSMYSWVLTHFELDKSKSIYIYFCPYLICSNDHKMFRYLVYWLALKRSLAVNRNLFHYAWFHFRKIVEQMNRFEWTGKPLQFDWYRIVIHWESIQFILNYSIRKTECSIRY